MKREALDFEVFQALEEENNQERIVAAHKTLGEDVVLLCHHYQQDEVYRHADLTGDSLKLSRLAAQTQARTIVFCGVHFMAEVADILSRPGQQVILPDLAAGCSMADMANLVKVRRCWAELADVVGDADAVCTPLTYINSAADLKAFCGEHGGSVCTSSNAEAMLKWAFARTPKVLFFPDQHLGRWSGYKLGVPLSEMKVWNPDMPRGGLTRQEIMDAKILLWAGHCSVHQMFQPEHVAKFRAENPQGKVISHPESPFEVCRNSDLVGSTEFILNTVRASKSGDSWLVGTELNLVNRLAREMEPKGVTVRFMSPLVCMCSTMARIDSAHLAWCLENLANGNVVNPIKVPEHEAKWAKEALARMFAASV